MRRRSTSLWVCAALVYAFLYVPLIIVVAYSFNDSRLNAEWVRLPGGNNLGYDYNNDMASIGVSWRF